MRTQTSFCSAILGALGFGCAAVFPQAPAFAATNNFSVSITLNEAHSKTDDDADGPDDIYWDVTLGPTVGLGDPVTCNRQDDHEDDNNDIKPNWICTAFVTGDDNVNMQIFLALMEHDTTSADDEFDINPLPGQLGILMNYRPATSLISFPGIAGRDAFTCAPGQIRIRGFNGDDQAEVVFTVSSSLVGAPNGDSDSDGLPDTWEVCGVDGNGDGSPEVKLNVLGANRYRKDAFVELDFMEQPGPGGHTHAPWLPSLVNAWNEFNLAPVTNPTVGGVPNASGIALHVDVGNLYAGYGVDYDGNGTIDFPRSPALPPADGNFDLSGDTIPDIGDLGALERNTPTPDATFAVSNNVLAENPSMNPSSFVPIPPATTIDGHRMFDTGSDFFNLKAANFNSARDSSFRYVIFGHSYPSALLGGPAGSSGLADGCGNPSCSDFIVSLGGYGRQTVDADLNGAPDIDPPPPLLPVPRVVGPRPGLPVDGTFNNHTGTFLHELGHTMALRHGGVDDTNFKPNFLSIMSYSFQMRGLGFDPDSNGTADQIVGLSLDGDQVNDLQRFIYSGLGNLSPVLGPLNEGVPSIPPAPPATFLNENNGVAAGGLGITTTTRYSCPPLPTPPPGTTTPPMRFNRADQLTDWNCSSPPGPFPPQPNVTADINNENFNSNALEILNGADDYNILRGGSLAFQPSSPGISLDEQIQMDSHTQRIVEPRAREGQDFERLCEHPLRIDFEDLADGTVVENQYGVTARFLRDDLRTPTIVGPAGRNNIPTQSPDQSLINYPRRGGAPLVVEFYPPQRLVSLYFGQAGLTNSQRERIRAVLRATDQNELPMGEIVKSIPLPNAGVRTLLAAESVWGDELIKRIALSYETDFDDNNRVLDEPVLIDDLIVCAKLDDSDVPAIEMPKGPVFGDIPVNLKINAEYFVRTPAADGGADHFTVVKGPFTGLAVTVDGTTSITDLMLTRPEGTTVKVEAPPSFGGFEFVTWRYTGGVAFGNKTTQIPLTLLHDGTLTAVYRSDRFLEQPHPQERDDGRHFEDWRFNDRDAFRRFRMCIAECALDADD